jgi:hypothetical protein
MAVSLIDVDWANLAAWVGFQQTCTVQIREWKLLDDGVHVVKNNPSASLCERGLER